jgi:hypothetical protein
LENPNITAGKYVEIDATKLQALRVIFDSNPEGHVTVRPETLAELRAWAAARGTGQIHPFTQELLDAIIGIGRK